ncbi:MAG: MoxR family ATPase [Vulcanimicrobiota bacterium]
MSIPHFQGTEDYLTDPALESAVNCALALEKPLLVRGEPGTGKTLLADAIASSLSTELIHWSIKSTTKADSGLYHYDAVSRLYDSRFQDRDVSDIGQYIRLGPLGQAFSSDQRVVLLIDEVDKADIEFPNDLLHELDRMRFFIRETGEEVVARHRPVVVITSNNEKELPDPFLRRCIFHYLEFPTPEFMQRILDVHHPNLEKEVAVQALEVFYNLREMALRKKPTTSELIDWIAALKVTGAGGSLLEGTVPLLGLLLKKEQDLMLVSRQWAHRGVN